MKKQKTLAVLLSAAMVAGAIPTAALAEVVEINSESGLKAAELNVDQHFDHRIYYCIIDRNTGCKAWKPCSIK